MDSNYTIPRAHPAFVISYLGAADPTTKEYLHLGMFPQSSAVIHCRFARPDEFRSDGTLVNGINNPSRFSPTSRLIIHHLRQIQKFRLTNPQILISVNQVFKNKILKSIP